MDTYRYKPSGKFSGSFFLWLALFLVIGIPLISFAYIYAVHYVPFIYVTILFAFMAGAGLGYLVYFAVKKGKNRSPVMVIICTVVAAILMKYVQWAFYVPLILNDVYEMYEYYYGYKYSLGEQLLEALWFLVHPQEIWWWALDINEWGVWGLTNSTTGDVDSNVTGIPLLLIWIGEFAIMLGTAIAVVKRQPSFPFSEEHDMWYVEMKDTYDLAIPQDIDSLKGRLQAGDVARLVELTRHPKNDETDFLRLTLFESPMPSHAEPYYGTLTQIVVNQKNKQKVHTYVEYMTIDVQSAKDIMSPALPVYDNSAYADPMQNPANATDPFNMDGGASTEADPFNMDRFNTDENK